MTRIQLRAALTAGALCTALVAAAQQGPAHPAAQPSSHGQPASASTPPATTAAGQRTPEDEQRRAQKVAKYREGEVTVAELEDAVNSQNPPMRRRYNSIAALQDLLAHTVRFDLLAAEAKRRGYGDNTAVRDGMDQSTVQQMMRADFDEKLTPDKVAAPEIEARYKANLDEFVQPALQRASHILLANEADAKAVLEKARSMDAAAFRALARDKSLDSATKDQGGDLRYFDVQGKPRNDDPTAKAAVTTSVPAPIVKAAFALKTVGELAPKPIKVDGGYSVVKLTGSRVASSRSLDEVRETLRMQLWREQREKAIEDFVIALRAKFQPEVHPERIDLIKLESLPEPKVPTLPNATAKPHAR